MGACSLATILDYGQSLKCSSIITIVYGGSLCTVKMTVKRERGIMDTTDSTA